jgi:nicotinamide riboside transporter PnuC
MKDFEYRKWEQKRQKQEQEQRRQRFYRNCREWLVVFIFALLIAIWFISCDQKKRMGQGSNTDIHGQAQTHTDGEEK